MESETNEHCPNLPCLVSPGKTRRLTSASSPFTASPIESFGMWRMPWRSMLERSEGLNGRPLVSWNWQTPVEPEPCIYRSKTRKFLRLPYDSLSRSPFKNPNDPHPMFSASSISTNDCNWFTSPKSKWPNNIGPPYGFTTPRGYIQPYNLQYPEQSCWREFAQPQGYFSS